LSLDLVHCKSIFKAMSFAFILSSFFLGKHVLSILEGEGDLFEVAFIQISKTTLIYGTTMLAICRNCQIKSLPHHTHSQWLYGVKQLLVWILLVWNEIEDVSMWFKKYVLELEQNQWSIIS